MNKEETENDPANEPPAGSTDTPLAPNASAPDTMPGPAAPEKPASAGTTSSTPEYEMIRCIGRGAYGEVYLARDPSGVYRAVKVIFRESFDHERPFEREYEGICKFERVARSYDNQVQVFHVGRREQPRQFYYIMELADDQQTGQKIHPDSYEPKTLRSELKSRGRLPVKECVSIGLALSRALENLHESGLIHRDIKPANIIFVNGRPKLADIGLVTDRDATVSFVGTDGYIPPEGPSSPQADIYSLGKVLYEMCTGRDRMEYPELPTNLGELPDREMLLELNEVIRNACERDPGMRYKSAARMRADLQWLRQGRSVRKRQHLRKRFAAVGLAVGLVLLVAGGIALWREFQSGPAKSPPPALIAWWPGDGNAADYAGTNNATFVNGAELGTGMVGQAFKLNGSGACVRAPDSPLWSFGTHDFTIALWAKPASARSGQALIACDEGRGDLNKWIFWLNDGEVRLHVNRANLGGFDIRGISFSPKLNQWHHLAVTRQSSQYVFFIDGTAVSTNTNIGVMPTLSAPLTIGAAEEGNFFNGLIDEVRIYNGALAASEIKTIYDTGTNGMARAPAKKEDAQSLPTRGGVPPPAGLIAWWPGDGRCNDIVGTHNGVPVNGADYAPGLIGQAFRVNGTRQYFSIPHTPSLSFTNGQPFTLEAWVCRTGGGLPFHVLGKRDSAYGCWYQLGFDDSFPPVPLHTWTHLVTTRDGTNAVSYYDGVPVRQSRDRCPGPNTADFQIGSSDTSGFFTGLIDEVRIYNRALAASEVKAIYDAGANGMRPPPARSSAPSSVP